MPLDFDTFVKTLNYKLEPPVQHHLKNVYACVAISSLAAAVGALFHFYIASTIGLLSGLASFGFMIALMSTEDDGKNRQMRLGYLIGFAFCSGIGLGPFLDLAIAVDPSIIPTALLSTCVIFTCFTLSSFFSNQQRWINLGGTLLSFLMALSVLSLVNFFIGSSAIMKFQIYAGLLIMCAFIMYDTQYIIEKRRRGEKDYIWHSICIFIDLVQVFRYVLVILIDKENSKKSKK